MSSAALKADLNSCLVNFDRRVRVTDLLEQYLLPYNVVHETLESHMSEQEQQHGVKYEKRYLVHGDEHNGTTEVFTVVQGEAKLKEWLRKLKNAESSLYSVEVAGGAKAPAPNFKPMRHCAVILEDIKAKNVNRANKWSEFAASSNGSPAEVSAKHKETEKIQPEDKKTTDNKIALKKATNKIGISNFFTPATANNVKTEKPKEAKASTSNKSAPKPTPKKDFFKKQNEAAVIAAAAKAQTSKSMNISVQLFENEEEPENEPECSSDEEEKMDALKRDIITSDHEECEEAGTSVKRRRIDDTDDEEAEPQLKHEKKEEVKVVKSETYMDDDGFVITIKPKKNPKVSPPSKKVQSPPKVQRKPKASPAAAAKTKQGNIMNFFTKK